MSVVSGLVAKEFLLTQTIRELVELYRGRGVEFFKLQDYKHFLIYISLIRDAFSSGEEYYYRDLQRTMIEVHRCSQNPTAHNTYLI